MARKSLIHCQLLPFFATREEGRCESKSEFGIALALGDSPTACVAKVTRGMWMVEGGKWGVDADRWRVSLRIATWKSLPRVGGFLDAKKIGKHEQEQEQENIGTLARAGGKHSRLMAG
jgi:hypothetical protein